MLSSNIPHSLGVSKWSSSAGRKPNGIVDAVLINTPDLSFFLKLQNLLNYFVDCMNSLTVSHDNHAVCAEHIKRCIGFLSSIDRSGVTMDDDLCRVLDEFIVDAHQFQSLFNSLGDQSVDKTADQTAAVLLTAKASHLQWLSVCILEDVKKSYCRS